MKNSLIKSALVAVAAIAAGSAFAATSTNQIFGVTFENTVVQNQNDHAYVAGDGVTNYPGWTALADSDQSIITTEVVAAGQQALKLSTEGTELKHDISTLNSDIASAIEDGSAVFESKVKFVATDTLLTGLPEGIDNTKFAIYAYSAGDGSPTNLVVYHQWQDYADGDAVNLFTNEITTAVIDTEDFTTISVELKKYTSIRKTAMAFQVSVNGQVVTSALPFSDSIVDGETFESIVTYPLGNTFMETVNNSSGTEFSEIAFKGTGYVDDIAIKTVATIVETTYTAKFVDDKNNTTNTVSDITAGDTVAAPETNPSFTGFTFEGWALEDTTTAVTFPYTVNADVTFVALWSENATPDEEYAENDTVNGETITAAQATWLNEFIGEGKQYADKAAFEAALANKTSELTIADSYLLGVNPISGGAVFTVTGIAVDDANGTVDITVSLDRSGAVNDSINGTLKVKGYATLGGSATDFVQTVSAADFNDGDLTETYTVTPENDEVFFKAAVE